MPPVFEDPNYWESLNFRLSTSQVRKFVVAVAVWLCVSARVVPGMCRYGRESLVTHFCCTFVCVCVCVCMCMCVHTCLCIGAVGTREFLVVRPGGSGRLRPVLQPAPKLRSDDHLVVPRLSNNGHTDVRRTPRTIDVIHAASSTTGAQAIQALN